MSTIDDMFKNKPFNPPEGHEGTEPIIIIKAVNNMFYWGIFEHQDGAYWDVYFESIDFGFSRTEAGAKFKARRQLPIGKIYLDQ